MIERFGKLIIFFCTIALIGCTGTETVTSTYFGGKIINPKSKYVVLYTNDVPIDTFYLDKHNKFLGEINSCEPGLYHFKHGPEHQFVYLTPADSLLLRLNTWDFDESLVYSGKGAARNNALIDCFLDNEKDDRKHYPFYKLDPISFKEKMDSVELDKLERYQQFVMNNPNESEDFLKLLKIAFTYPIYSQIENYPIAHSARKNDSHHKNVNSDFYAHRKHADYKNNNFLPFYAYRDYVVSHLYNKVFSEGHTTTSDAFTEGLLKSIAEEITDVQTKNAMLRQTIIGHFYRKSSCSVNQNTFETYFDLSSSDDDKKLIKSLIKDINSLHKGKKLHNFEVLDYNKSSKSIASLVKGKNAVIYFWNPDIISREFLSSRVKYLTKKFPDVKFVGVRINGNGKDRLKQIDIKDQYYITKQHDATQFLSSELPRTLLVNRKGIITNGYASFSSQNIYSQVKDLSKE